MGEKMDTNQGDLPCSENRATDKPLSKEPIIVIVPARNEEASIEKVVKNAQKEIHGHVLVIDDHSSDKTAAIAKKAGAHVLSLAAHSGAWVSIQTGFRYALKKNCHAVVTMDGDGQHLADHIPDLIDALSEKKAAMAIGAFPERGSMARKIAWRFFKTITGLNLNDMTSGFRAYNKDAISLLSSNEAALLDYQDIGVILMLKKNRLKICEVDTPMAPRASGHSRIFDTWFAVSKYLVYSVLISFSRTHIPFGKKTP